MTDLRTAAQQEPVNYFEVQRIANERGLDYNKFSAALRDYLDAHPALAQQEPVPVARVIDDETPEGSTEWIPYSGRQVPVKTGDLLYTHPPRREWQSLSEEEIVEIVAECAASAHRWDDISVARAIEQALKERNT